MERNIKKEPPTEFVCILPAFRADKKLSGKDIVESEVQVRSHYTCEVCNRLCESEIKLTPTCLKFVIEVCLKKHLKLHELKKQPPKFKCHICKRVFFIRDRLKEHIKEHSRSFECDYCGIIRRRKSYLVDHLKEHTNPNKFKCQICAKMFRTFRTLWSHNENSHSERKFACEKCDMKFKNRHRLRKHTKVHEDRIKCHICFGMYSASSIARHIKMHETKKQEAKFHCHVCPRKFYYNTLLKNHLNAHIKPFKCNLCEKRFAGKVSLQDHLAVHAEPDIFKCKYCDMKITSKYHLKKHELRCQRGFYQCDQCPFEHRSKLKLFFHVVTHRKQKKPKNKSKCQNCSFVAETKLEVIKHRHKDHHGRYCAQCDKTFQTNEIFEKHKSNHEKLSGDKCRICGLNIKTVNITKHMKMHKKYPNQDLSAECEVCQRTYSTHQTKIDHMNRVHQRSEKCSCDHCGKIFTSKWYMAWHMISKHSSDESRERFKCSKDYYSKGGLREHEATHGERLLFKCHICSTSLVSKQSLRRHLNIHLSKPKSRLNCSRTNPFKGHKCDMMFASKKTLKKHLKSVHAETTIQQTLICDKCGEKFPSQENLLHHLKKQIVMRNSIRPFSISLEPLNINNRKPKQRLNSGRQKTRK